MEIDCDMVEKIVGCCDYEKMKEYLDKLKKVKL